MTIRPLKSTAAVRQHNAKMMLELIEARGPISRAELSRVTGLSQPAIGGAVEGLLSIGLVRSIGEGASSGGRRPLLLAFHGGAGYAIGVDLGGTSVKLCLTDLAGKVYVQLDVPTPRVEARVSSSDDPVIAAIYAAALRLVAEADIAWEKITGIGIGVPGATDPEAGVVRLAPAVKWDNVPVRQLLSQRFGLPCYIENDVNAAALAELTLGNRPDLRSFVFVAIGTGIGAGIVIDGKILRGRTCSAGEVGYLVIDHTWQPRSVADFGCFETMAAAAAVRERAAKALSQAGKSTPVADAAQVFDLARNGDQAAMQVVDEIGGYIGVALANIAVLLDPDAIVLGGGVSQAGEVLLNPIRRRLAAISPITPAVVTSSLGSSAGMLGAAVLAIKAAKERLLSEV